MVLFFTSMFSTVSIYRLPCKTISGLWFGLLPSAEHALCCVTRAGKVWSRRAGHTGRGSCPRTGHPVTRLLITLQPELRCSPFPAAHAAGPALRPACPLPPQRSTCPPPHPIPTLWLRLPPFPPRLCPHGERPKVQLVHKGRMASSLLTSALKGQILDCSFRTKSIKNNCQERVRDPFRIQLIPKGKGAGPGAAGRPCAVKVGV